MDTRYQRVCIRCNQTIIYKNYHAFYVENKLEYEMIDPKKLTDEQIKELYVEGKIKFLDKYKQKFEERFL